MNKKEKFKYYLKRIFAFVIAPLCIMFKLGRAYERMHYMFSDNYDYRYSTRNR